MRTKLFVVGGLTGLVAASASGSIIVNYSDPSGLSAEAEFTVINPTTLEVRLRNTSTGFPMGKKWEDEPSNQLLTAISWDFGPAGPAGIQILGGTVFTGPTSMSLNFSIMNVGANADVSGEWGYSNTNESGLMQNYFSSQAAAMTVPFGGANLDGTVGLNGPQGGLVADPVLIPLGGIGAIQDEVIATLTLSGAITEAQLQMDLDNNGSRIEFGSDAFFIFVPAPGALAMLAVAGAVGGRRRRRA